MIAHVSGRWAPRKRGIWGCLVTGERSPSRSALRRTPFDNARRPRFHDAVDHSLGASHDIDGCNATESRFARLDRLLVSVRRTGPAAGFASERSSYSRIELRPRRPARYSRTRARQAGTRSKRLSAASKVARRSRSPQAWPALPPFSINCRSVPSSHCLTTAIRAWRVWPMPGSAAAAGQCIASRWTIPHGGSSCAAQRT